jgi:uncharacterized membrane protein YeaQ/YmgE (transglycosylase-associated protein family)
VSDEVTHLIVSFVAAVWMFIMAILIRVRGPAGLVKNVDWSRVSDPLALGHFVSLILGAIGALIAAHGVTLYAFHAIPALRNMSTVVFIVLVCALTLALLLGQKRYQDKPKRNEHR